MIVSASLSWGAELRSKTGLVDAHTAAAGAAAAATEAFAALLPPGAQLVQLTHVHDLASASVFACLGSGLSGARAGSRANPPLLREASRPPAFDPLTPSLILVCW